MSKYAKRVLEDLANDRTREDAKYIAKYILPLINTGALVNESQEKWIRDIDFLDYRFKDDGYITIINSFRG